MERWPAATDGIGVWLEGIYCRQGSVLQTELEYCHSLSCHITTNLGREGHGFPFILEQLPGVEKQGHRAMVHKEQVGHMGTWQSATIPVYAHRQRQVRSQIALRR